MGRELAIRHFVNRSHVLYLPLELPALEALDELALGFARSQNQNRVRVTQAINDLVVVLVEVAHRLPLTLVFRHEVVGGVRFFHSCTTRGPCGCVAVGHDLQNVFTFVRNEDHNGLVMVDPYARIDRHDSSPFCYSSRVIPALIRECSSRGTRRLVALGTSTPKALARATWWSCSCTRMSRICSAIAYSPSSSH